MVMGSSDLPATQPLPHPVKKVVVFGMEPFGFTDLKRGVTPNLQRMVDEGAIGAMSVRGVARRPSDSEGYLTMGAGARLAAVSNAALVLPRTQMLGNVSAADYVESLSGTRPKGPFVVIGGPALVKHNTGPQAVSKPGTLATLLAQAGHPSAVVTNSDHPATLTANAVTNRSAALAVMDSSFGVAHGAIDPGKLLDNDSTAPYGIRASISGYASATAAALQRADLVVVDPGDLTRAQAYGGGALDQAKSAMWDASLKRSDEILGEITAQASPDTLVLVVSVRAPDGEFRLTPMVAWGAGVPKGIITSPSTQRSGLVAITDLAPTILSALGAKVPDTLPGNALRYEPGSHHIGSLETYDSDTVVRERSYFGMSWLYIWSHAVVYGLILFVVARRPRFTGLRASLRLALLCLGALPVASFLVRLVPGLTVWFVEAQGIASVLIAMLVGWFVSRRRAHALSSLAWLCAITVAVIVVDIWTGTHLEMSSWLGYSLHSAGRFYGVPNTTFAVLGACSLVWAGIVVHHAEQRVDALWGVACVLFVVLISSGAPMLGADVGTLMTLGPVFALFVYVLSGRTIKVRDLALAAAGMVALVVLGAAVDLARPPADRSHLGRFAADLLNKGPSVLTSTFTRKQSANFRILGGSIWTRLVPIVGVFLFYPLVWERRARAVFGDKRALRCTAWAVLGAAVLGFASNDSGPLVISLFIAWLPPLVALILLDRSNHTAELVFADGSPSRLLPSGRRPGRARRRPRGHRARAEVETVSAEHAVNPQLGVDVPVGVSWVVGFVAAAVAAVAAWVAMRDTFEQPLFARRNYRGVDVPVGVGVLVAVVTVGVSGAWLALESLGDATPRTAELSSSLALVCLLSSGFGLLGLFDDLAARGRRQRLLRPREGTAAGSAHDRRAEVGRRGVARTGPGVGDLARARVLARVALGGAVISLAANLGNLFDRAPGRCTKVALGVRGGALRVRRLGRSARPDRGGGGARRRARARSVRPARGAHARRCRVERARGRVGLGGRGHDGLGGEVVVLGALVVLNAASEKVSFSAVIASTPPLRAFDQLGRRQPPD